MVLLSWLYRLGALLGALSALVGWAGGRIGLATASWILAVVLFATGFGLSRLWRWAWVAALAVTGLALAGATSKVAALSPIYLGNVVFHGLVLVYLVYRRDAFLVRGRQAESDGQPA